MSLVGGKVKIMAYFESICDYSAPLDSDIDCPKCKSKKSLSHFERSLFPVSINNRTMFTEPVLWYGCRICAYKYVDAAFQKEYNATVLALSNKIKDELIAEKKVSISAIKLFWSFVFLAVAINIIHKCVLLMVL